MAKTPVKAAAAVQDLIFLWEGVDKRGKRVKEVRDGHAARNLNVANRFRELLKEWYGAEAGTKVKYAEAFEICEYGRRPDKTELKRLFPFFK